MKAAILILVFILASIVIAEGADWVSFEITSDGIDYSVDVSSIKEVRPNIIRAWFSTSIERTRYVDLLEFDCTQNKWRMLEFISYYSDGTSQFDTASGKWHSVTPETKTITESALKFVCNEWHHKSAM